MSKKGLYPIDFNNFNVFDFYDRYKNLNRIYLFDLLTEFNLLSEYDDKLSVTFDSITKLGLLLNGILNINENSDVLNKFLIRIILNSTVGYAMPIFRYDGKVYLSSKKITEIINLNNNLNKLINLGDEILKNKTIIFNLKITNENNLIISYQNINSLDNV